MKRKWLVIIIATLFVVGAFVLWPKNKSLRLANGHKISVQRSATPFWKEGSTTVFKDDEKVFSLWRDFFDDPIFIYPFDDGKRFLCDYDYDTAILVFVVDLDTGHTNLPGPSRWSGELSSSLDHCATNVVLETKGVVRLPTDAELREARESVMPSKENANSASPPHHHRGIYCASFPKKDLLLHLADDRSSSWPISTN
jgi:hypothetical protein